MRSTIITTLLAASTLGLATVPAAAEAQRWAPAPYAWNDGYGDGSRQDVGYRRDRRYYRQDRYRGGNRCYDKGRGGLAIGAVAGGLLGNAVAGRGDRTLGTVLGGVVGALAGQAVDKSDGRRC